MGYFSGNERTDVYQKIGPYQTKVKLVRQTVNAHLGSLEKRIEDYVKNPLKGKGSMIAVMNAIAKELDAFFFVGRS
jgi:hypothetical protein